SRWCRRASLHQINLQNRGRTRELVEWTERASYQLGTRFWKNNYSRSLMKMPAGDDIYLYTSSRRQRKETRGITTALCRTRRGCSPPGSPLLAHSPRPPSG